MTATVGDTLPGITQFIIPTARNDGGLRTPQNHEIIPLEQVTSRHSRVALVTVASYREDLTCLGRACRRTGCIPVFIGRMNWCEWVQFNIGDKGVPILYYCQLAPQNDQFSKFLGVQSHDGLRNGLCIIENLLIKALWSAPVNVPHHPYPCELITKTH